MGKLYIDSGLTCPSENHSFVGQGLTLNRAANSGCPMASITGRALLRFAMAALATLLKNLPRNHISKLEDSQKLSAFSLPSSSHAINHYSQKQKNYHSQ